jgi:hypothetical protein
MKSSAYRSVRAQFASLGVIPTLADEVASRRGCRAGLNGRLVEYGTQVFSVHSTSWDESRRLLVRLEIGPDRSLTVHSEDCRLFDDWPPVCCRPSKAILRERLAARLAEKGDRR